VKNLKIASLVLIFLAYTFGVYTIGANTSHNNILWKALVNAKELPIYTSSEDQKTAYQQFKKEFALTTEGDHQ
jgi:hypothetical protein